MKRYTFLLIACALLAMGTVSPDGPCIEAGVLKGRITNATGSPVVNATVVIADTANAKYIYATSDNNGYYEISVPAGTWTASVQWEVNYLGQAHTFDLHPDNAASFTGAAGAIRNFTWKLYGRRPEGGYYGGSLTVKAAPGTEMSLDNAELTLTPNGPLADGSAGEVIVTKLTKNGDVYSCNDIPVGRYVITALDKTSKEVLQFLDAKDYLHISSSAARLVIIR